MRKSRRFNQPQLQSPGVCATVAILGSPDAELPPPPPMPVTQNLPLRSIVPSPFQVRRFGIPDSENQDLINMAASIRSGGVIQPIIVRAKEDGTWELVAGEQRYRSSCLQGPELDAFGPPPLYIPAVIRGYTDHQAHIACVTENLQRRDLKPFEEVEGVASLLGAFAGDAEAVASQLGQTANWVASRARIHTHLTPAWRDAIGEGAFPLWTIGHMAEIARLAPEIQNAVLEDNYTLAEYGVGELRAYVAQYTRELGRAIFSLEDETLCPDAGACNTCVLNTLASPFLFADQGDVHPQGDIHKARCLNASCWLEKSRTHLERRAAALREEHGNDLVLVDGDEEGDRSLVPPSLRRQVEPLGRYWEKTKKGADGAVPAMEVSGPKPGRLIWIRSTRPTPSEGAAGPTTAPANGRSPLASTPAPTSAPSAAEPADQSSLTERRQRLHNRRISKMSTLVQELLRDFDAGGLDQHTLLSLVLALGTYGRGHYGVWDVFDSACEMSRQDLAISLWQTQIAPVLSGHLVYNGPATTQKVEQHIRRALQVVGRSYQNLFLLVAAEIPEPQCWRDVEGYAPEDLGDPEPEPAQESQPVAA